MNKRISSLCDSAVDILLEAGRAIGFANTIEIIEKTDVQVVLKGNRREIVVNNRRGTVMSGLRLLAPIHAIRSIGYQAHRRK